jgi:hypothetical protein
MCSMWVILENVMTICVEVITLSEVQVDERITYVEETEAFIGTGVG